MMTSNNSNNLVRSRNAWSPLAKTVRTTMTLTRVAQVRLEQPWQTWTTMEITNTMTKSNTKRTTITTMTNDYSSSYDDD